MKSLGAIICAALMAFSFVGTSAPASDDMRTNPFVLEAQGINEEITGFHIDPTEAELYANEAFTLPPGAIGVQATYDVATDVLSVVPISAVPDAGAKSNCLMTGAPNFGYTQAFPNLGACATPVAHMGTVDSVTLACVSDQYCYVQGFGFSFAGGFSYQYLYIVCQNSTVSIATQAGPAPNGPITPIGNGICFAYGFTLGAPIANHNGYVYQFPPTGIVLGIVN